MIRMYNGHRNFNLNSKYTFNLFIWTFTRQYILSSCLKDWRSNQNCFAVHWWSAVHVLLRVVLNYGVLKCKLLDILLIKYTLYSEETMKTWYRGVNI
jgi:hypothetical protein